MPQERKCSLLIALTASDTSRSSRRPRIVEGRLSNEALNAAGGAAAVMVMNNVYYRFVHLVANPEYGKMPARLRMNIIGSHGIAKEEFELMSLAVSAMNGCGMCIDSHERVLLEHGMKSEAIQSAVPQP